MLVEYRHAFKGKYSHGSWIPQTPVWEMPMRTPNLNLGRLALILPSPPPGLVILVASPVKWDGPDQRPQRPQVQMLQACDLHEFPDLAKGSSEQHRGLASLQPWGIAQAHSSSSEFLRGTWLPCVYAKIYYWSIGNGYTIYSVIVYNGNGTAFYPSKALGEKQKSKNKQKQNHLCELQPWLENHQVDAVQD